MKAKTALWALAAIMTVLTATATAQLTAGYQRPCGTGIDLCTWNKTMPLGSGNCCGCNLGYNTPWPLGTEQNPTIETVMCTFDGSQYQDHDLFISIDNDIISCTLNGQQIVGFTVHEGCADVDPRDGYQYSISPVAGTNTIVCQVQDRGMMSHFDACVVGEEPIPPLPEFTSLALPLMILLTVPTVAFILARKYERL